MDSLPLGKVFTFATAFCSLFLATTVAQIPAVSFDTSIFWSTNGGVGTFGWEFKTTGGFRIASLGFYDNFSGGMGPGDGLLESHQVGIWDISAPDVLIVTGLIPAGEGAALINGFRYIPIEPVALPAGHSYAIGAFYENLLDQNTGTTNNPEMVQTFAPLIQHVATRFGRGSTLRFPDEVSALYNYGFGPNFLYDNPVPEPSTYGLFAAGALVGLIAWRRKHSLYSNHDYVPSIQAPITSL